MFIGIQGPHRTVVFDGGGLGGGGKLEAATALRNVLYQRNFACAVSVAPLLFITNCVLSYIIRTGRGLRLLLIYLSREQTHLYTR